MEQNDKINELASDEASEQGSTSLTFEISAGGLEFEIGDFPSDTKEDEPAAKSDSETSAPTVELDESEPTEEEHISTEQTAEEQTAPAPVETLTGDLFDSAPRVGFYEEPIQMRTTYVPRFTSASEKYRMRGVAADEEPRSRVEEAPAPDESIRLDATAEMEDGAVDGIVVAPVSQRLNEPIDESITLYKFDRTVSEQRIPTASNIHRPEPEQPVPVPQIDDVPVIKDEKRGVGSYDIPDPDGGVRRSSVARYRAGDDPDGIYASSDSKEFSSPAQRDEVKDRFLDSLMATRIRLVFSMLLLLGLVAVEILGFAGIELGRLISGNPGAKFAANAVVDLLFSVCLFLLAIPEVIRSVRGIASKTVLPELFISLAWIVIIIYDACIIGAGVLNYARLGMLYAVLVTSAIYASYARLKTDFNNFKIISKNTIKRVLDKKLTRELPRENMAVDGLVDEYSSMTARMFRTAFVSDFGKHSSMSAENSSRTLLVGAVALAASVITSLVAFFVGGGDVGAGLQSFITVFMLTVPALTLLTHKLPYNHCSREASLDGGAFIGERAFREGANVDVLTYEDTEVFGTEDVTIRKVHLYGKAYNTAKAMKQMFAIFSVVGGPLDHVFSAALDGKGDSAADIRIEGDGISGVLDGKPICAGTEEYMRRHGVRIPEDDYKSGVGGNDSTKVMYGAEGGEVYVKFFIRYSFSEEFTMIIPYFRNNGVVPLIYTRDPNISCDLVRVLTSGDDIIRVMKKDEARSGIDKTYPRLGASIVTVGNKTDAFNMVLLAKKYNRLQTHLSYVELAAMLGGAAVSVLLSLFGGFGIPAMVLAAWQVAWCVYMYVKSRISFKRRKTEKGNQ